MGNYKNGLETKTLIYNNAKRLFLENGFSETTVRNIAEVTNAKVGLINYYFESKDALGCAIHKELTDNLHAAAEKSFCLSTPLTMEMAIEYHVISYMVYFEFYNQTPKASKLYCALCGTDKFPVTLVQELSHYTNSIIKIESPILFNERLQDKIYFDTLHSMLCGMEIQLMQDLICGRLNIPFHQAIDIYLGIYFQQIFNDTDLITHLIASTREQISHIRFSFDENYNIIIK